jgi:hypothetical protein
MLVGLGVDWKLQVNPFHTSANDTSSSPLMYQPTASQASAAVHETPIRKLSWL